MTLTHLYEIKHRAEENLKCFICQIEILETAWDYKEGDILEVPVIALTEKAAEQMLDGKFFGSEYPSWRLKSINQLGDNFLFGIIIQDTFFRKAYQLGKGAGKQKQ